MVSGAEVARPGPAQLQVPGHSEEDDSDTVSTTSSEAAPSSMAIYDEAAREQLAFGNVAITNSRDVHFGNKTYYQGPVTIKQFLYANGADERLKGLESKVGEEFEDGAQDNVAFEGDGAVVDGECERGAPNGKGVVEEKADVAGAGTTKKDVHLFHKKPYFLLGVGVLLFLLLSVTVLCTLLTGQEQPTDASGNLPGADNDEQEIGTPVDAPLDPAVNISFPTKLKLISRLEWVAQPPVEELDDLKLPVPLVIIQHTATENCSSQPQCVFHMRYIQMFHVESRHWSDIGYNFLVGGDGNAYVGRGWTKMGAHTYGFNYKSVGIAFIGTFSKVLPPPQQLAACKYLIQKGVEQGYVAKDYKLLAHRQLQTTESPGLMLYEELKTWPHWSKEP